MRTVLITGASRGIGRSIATLLLSQGHRLCLAVRDPDGLRDTALDPRLHGDALSLCRYDARDPDAAERAVQAVQQAYGSLDTLIHCAGILRSTPLLFGDAQRDEPDELWRVNVKAPWLLTRAAWSALVASQAGRIQVLVSMSGKRCKGKLAGYSASKFALMGLCQAMRNEGWDKGIRVTAICPGWVNTEMARGISPLAPELMTQPDDIASLCAQLLKLPASAVPFELALNPTLES